MKIIDNLDLTLYNSYRLKSICARAFFPNTEEEILYIYKNNPDKNIYVIGNGNNIILSKNWYDSYFIVLNNCFDKYKLYKNFIVAEAGCTMQKLSEAALTHNLTGLEIFYDIPGSVGGAVVMNAGAYGEEIKDLIIKVKYLDLKELKIKTLYREEMEFVYRSSVFQKHSDKIVLKAWFKLKTGNHDKIKEKMGKVKNERYLKQPRDYPNCGSVFKRPPNVYVGPMIDNLGLKGFTIGGAQISEKHSGFIINKGNATAEDILQIIFTVKKLVKDRYNIDLEVEQKII